MIIRAQKEILEKIETGFEKDWVGYGVSDILEALSYKELEKSNKVKPEFFETITEKEWEETRLKTRKDVLNKIEGYLPFAKSKIDDERGLSADRSCQHFIAWTWLIDDEFSKELEDTYSSNYGNYGINVYNKVVEYIQHKSREFLGGKE